MVEANTAPAPYRVLPVHRHLAHLRQFPRPRSVLQWDFDPSIRGIQASAYCIQRTAAVRPAIQPAVWRVLGRVETDAVESSPNWRFRLRQDTSDCYRVVQ